MKRNDSESQFVSGGSIDRGSLEKHTLFLKMLDTENNGRGAFWEYIPWFVYFDDQSPSFQPRSNKSVLHISCPAVRRTDALGLTSDGWKRRESLLSLCARLVYLAEQNWLPGSKNHPICFCQCRLETLFLFCTISRNLESGAFFKCFPFLPSFSTEQPICV